MNCLSNYFVKGGIVAGIVSLAPFSMYSQKAADNQKLPNILVILADDLGFGDLACQGAADLKTPNIDRIFSEGVRFTNFYVNSTVCSPTRAALLSGRYPDMVGVPGVIRTHEDDSWGFLNPGVKLLPDYLKKAGYSTALIGKWHLGLEAPNLPNLRGFDHFHGFLGDMMDDYYTHLRHGNNYMRLNEEVINPKGHATDIFTDWAVDYLESRKTDDQPFFVYLAYNAPHDPVQPPEEWIQKVRKRDAGISDKRVRLIALIEHMDYNIGRILDQIHKSGKMENTIIVFTSDNGGVLGNMANNGPYRGGKQDMYEGGLRVPAAVMWKKRIPSGGVHNGLTVTMDLMPTLCEAAGIKTLESIDGVSFLPDIMGQRNNSDQRILYFMRREGGLKYGGLAYYAARSGDFKIVQNTPWQPMQMFNLKEDPYETNPKEIIGNKSSEELFRQLTRHIRQSGAIPWQKQ